MSENEHHAKAKSRLHNGTTNEITRAQAEATLALAYEQRTANLIAYLAWADDHNANVSVVDYSRIADQVTERLAP